MKEKAQPLTMDFEQLSLFHLFSTVRHLKFTMWSVDQTALSPFSLLCLRKISQAGSANVDISLLAVLHKVGNDCKGGGNG